MSNSEQPTFHACRNSLYHHIMDIIDRLPEIVRPSGWKRKQKEIDMMLSISAVCILFEFVSFFTSSFLNSRSQIPLLPFESTICRAAAVAFEAAGDNLVLHVSGMVSPLCVFLLGHRIIVVLLCAATMPLSWMLSFSAACVCVLYETYQKSMSIFQIGECPLRIIPDDK